MLTFDPCYMGESAGEPRHVFSPELFTENFSAGIDYLGLQSIVDRKRIAVLGICGSGGFALAAAQVDTRIKAVIVTSSLRPCSCMTAAYPAHRFTDVLPVNVSVASPFAGTDLFLCAIFGGIISGVGSGMAICYGGAMDGVEVIAVIFAKRLGLSIGSFVMVYNVLLYIVCGFVIQSWILPLYSVVTYAAAQKPLIILWTDWTAQKRP